jgi:hypothetical protein
MNPSSFKVAASSRSSPSFVLFIDPPPVNLVSFVALVASLAVSPSPAAIFPQNF